jgi:hypothetical protein
VDTADSGTKPFSWRLVGALVLVALAVVAVTVWFYVATFGGSLSTVHEQWGQFGDYVGGVLNPAFGFLSFGALLIALVLQSKELQASTRELRASAQALRKQHDVLTRQTFENTYFQLLRRVSDKVSELRLTTRNPIDGSAHTFSGNEVLVRVFSDLRDLLSTNPNTTEGVRQAFQSFYDSRGRPLGHYFRTLYHVFAFVDRAEFSDEDKVMYANIARAQLSAVELALLFYNGTAGEGSAGLKRLTEKYGLLKDVTQDDQFVLVAHRENEKFYSPTAFMSAAQRREFWKQAGRIH